MGQPVVDLPDPLENGGVAKAASADDLLAQLATDEIDRLLAEADTDTKPVTAAPASAAPSDAAAPPISTPPTTEIPDWLAAQLPPANAPPPDATAIAPVPTAPAPVPPPSTEDDAEPLSPAAAALGEELDATEAMAGPAAALATPTPAQVEAPAASEPAIAAETSAPPAPTVAASTDIAELPALKSLDEPSPARGLPLILKPLEWISAPLDLCPDTVREMIGKAAILTLVNAVGVLIYVWMFRRHH